MLMSSWTFVFDAVGHTSVGCITSSLVAIATIQVANPSQVVIIQYLPYLLANENIQKVLSLTH